MIRELKTVEKMVEMGIWETVSSFRIIFLGTFLNEIMVAMEMLEPGNGTVWYCISIATVTREMQYHGDGRYGKAAP